MVEITGDLIVLAQNGTFDVIIHGCNCFCTMGGGIAKQIKDIFPSAYDADLKTIKGDINKLGNYTYTVINNLTIINLYTQYGFGNNGIPPFDYEAFTVGLRKIKQKFSGKKIAMPLIGAGLAGGDWTFISQIIQKELADEDVTVIIWEQNV